MTSGDQESGLLLKTLKSSLDDVLPTETTGIVGLGSVGSEKDLGGDDVVSSVLCVSESAKLRWRSGVMPDVGSADADSFSNHTADAGES